MGLFVKSLGAFEARHHLAGLLFLETAFAGVAVHEAGLLAQGSALGRGGVVGLVLNLILFARIDAHGLGLDARALGPLGLGGGLERAQHALGVGKVFEGQNWRLIKLAGMKVQLTVLDVEDIASDTLPVPVAGLFGEFL